MSDKREISFVTKDTDPYDRSNSKPCYLAINSGWYRFGDGFEYRLEEGRHYVLVIDD